jgi:prevent-host-death family protein
MITVGVKELKNKTSEFLRKAKDEGPVIVTSHGKPVAALMRLDPDEVEDFLLAHSPKIRAAVTRGIEDAKAGRVYSVEELLEEAEGELGE